MYIAQPMAEEECIEKSGSLQNIINKHCNGSTRIIMKLYLSMTGRDSDHSNYIYIYIDRENKTFSLFEPYGGHKGIGFKRNKVPWRRHSLKRIMGEEYTEDEQQCILNTGPQVYDKQDTGFCYSWTLLFSLLQMANPHLSQREIYKIVQRKIETSDQLNTLIRSFTKMAELMVPVMQGKDRRKRESFEYYMLKKGATECFARYKGKLLTQIVIPIPTSANKRSIKYQVYTPWDSVNKYITERRVYFRFKG